jgi:hypothetical protein
VRGRPERQEFTFVRSRLILWFRVAAGGAVPPSEVTLDRDAFIVRPWLRLDYTPNLVQMRCDFSSWCTAPQLWFK